MIEDTYEIFSIDVFKVFDNDEFKNDKEYLDLAKKALKDDDVYYGVFYSYEKD